MVPETHCRCSPMVPSSNPGNCKNSLLERHQEMPRGRTHQCQILDLPGEKRWHPPQPRTPGQDQDPSHSQHLSSIQKISTAKNDKGRHDQWLADMIVAQSEATGWPKKAIWKKLQSTEHIQNNAQQITFALGTNNGRHGLMQVWGPTNQ